MKLRIFTLLISLCLTGCFGTYISGQTGHMGEEYPDIRSVPEREEALASRSLHGKEEEMARSEDFETLVQCREKIAARNEALREKLFPHAHKIEGKPVE